MPFKSEAQRRKLASLVEQGKFSASAFHEWRSASGEAKLPERAPGSKRKAKKPAKRKRQGRYI